MNRFASRITPRALGGTAICMLGLWTAVYCTEGNQWIPDHVLKLVSYLMAYGVALWLCIEIAAEYRSNRGLRAAWIFLGVCAAVSMVRHLFDTPLTGLVHSGYWNSPWSSLMREMTAAVALTFLAAGILTMASAFWRMRLGFSLRWIDFGLITVVFLVLSGVLYFRNDLSAAHLPFSVATRAQLFSQVMFAVAAGGCVLLMRISEQMGGGRLAWAMGWIIAHIVLRAVLVLANTVQTHLHKSLPASDFLNSLLLNAAIWMFAIAAATRYQVGATAARQAAEWGVTVDSVSIDAAA